MKERPFVSISENHNVPIKAPGKIILSTIEFGILDGKLRRLLSGLVVLLVQYIVFTGTLLAGNMVINEFDLNPAGRDSGSEWVVLYNPSEVELDISSWALETTHGKTVTVRIPQGTIMPPRGYWTYIHFRQWLDNEDELIILRDAEGVEVDRTLVARDRDNDNRYLTRYPDGLDTNSHSDWRFRERVLSKGVSFIFWPEEPSVNQMIAFDVSSSFYNLPTYLLLDNKPLLPHMIFTLSNNNVIGDVL